MIPSWPYLTAEIPPVPARIRQRAEDFVVEEIPLYAPCGTGDHVYALIEKVGLTTRRAVLALSRALGVPPGAIGVAGQKDARAVARQMVSVRGVDPVRLRSLALPGLAVLDVARHRAKLRPGSLRANRFALRLRGVPAERAGDVRALLDLLARRGAPNYFGPQRFGMRGDTWQVGLALLQEDFAGAAARVVGDPGAGEGGAVRRARELAAAGRFAEAARSWPDGFPDCARLCRLLDRADGDPRRAFFALDRRVLGLFVSAYQAWLFNRVLAERVAELDRVLAGDLAVCHLTGRTTLVEDPDSEQPRANRFEISPSGPIVGYSMAVPEGEPARIERRVFEEAGLSLRDLPRTGPLACVGGRRPLRFRPEEARLEAGADELGAYLEIRVVLPAGCYATSLLREICKDRLADGAPSGDEEA